MSSIERPPAIVRWTLRLEGATALDGPARALEPSIRSAFGGGARWGSSESTVSSTPCDRA